MVVGTVYLVTACLLLSCKNVHRTQTQVVEREGELSRLQSLLRQKQEEVERVGEVASKLTREKDSVADIVRQEFADR